MHLFNELIKSGHGYISCRLYNHQLYFAVFVCCLGTQHYIFFNFIKLWQ